MCLYKSFISILLAKATHKHLNTYSHKYIDNAMTVLEITAAWSLAIFRPITAFGQPKSILVSQIYCTFSMERQSVTNKMSYLQRKWPTNFWPLFLLLIQYVVQAFWNVIMLQFTMVLYACRYAVIKSLFSIGS